MADFDIPGINFARQALTTLAKNPRSNKGMTVIKTKMIKALYPEIRQARLAGYSWDSISKTIFESGLKPRISPKFLQRIFREVDLEYEKETGVKALPIEPHFGGRKRKATA